MVINHPNTYSNNWGSKMHFEHANRLAASTPVGVLCEAWGTSTSEVAEIKQSKRPMTIREAGALAELHGLKLEDILSVLSI
jgi:hypothetical protein